MLRCLIFVLVPKTIKIKNVGKEIKWEKKFFDIKWGDIFITL